MVPVYPVKPVPFEFFVGRWIRTRWLTLLPLKLELGRCASVPV